ncbi:VOC family protein [Leucobacter sp. GX24907]
MAANETARSDTAANRTAANGTAATGAARHGLGQDPTETTADGEVVEPGASRRHAELHHLEFDHLLWVVPDLAWGVEEFADRTGVQPRIGGSHPWTGTRNALVHLGGVTYVEIVAPDLEQHLHGAGLEGTIGGALLDVEPGVWTFAHSHRDLDGLVRTAGEAGYSTAGPRRWNRRGRDGSFMEWSVAFAGESEFGAAAPFYVGWEELIHPTAKMRKPALDLRSITVTAEDPAALRAFYDTVGIGTVGIGAAEVDTAGVDTVEIDGAGIGASAELVIEQGAPSVSVDVDSPNGLVTLPALDLSRHPLLRSTPEFMFRDA